ncbi:methylated-DNA--[protein]-cysteine S-methyltransferase [Thermodesulfobium sp. 4217-1]|uniref:methylated-DNA--[protein]-cysteine S-methyltransferase n=1 Tax=Thermodesulfobium sp. 4217-1 TaxID=3120013 RepID=UPI0032220FAB
MSYRYSNIYIVKENEFVKRIFLNDDSFLSFYEKNNPKRNDLILKDEVMQLTEYIDGKRKKFDIHYELLGTEFQKIVWEKILGIGYSEVKRYSDIAKEIDKPLATRAVGNACSKNVLPIIVPCHRIISTKGQGGFFGQDNEFSQIKSYLLNLERTS